MADQLPARRIDRGSIERIIQRAAELQTGERDISDGLTPDEVLALGKDVGIPERYIQQAILEERSRSGPPAPQGVLDGTVGPAVVRADRVVRGVPAEIEQRLLRYFDENELLTIQRQQPGRITWEPLRGVQGALRRSSAMFQSNRPFMLSKAQLVSVTIVPLESGFCQVSMTAELRGLRTGYLLGGSAISGVGLVTGGIFAVLSPFLWIAAVPVAMGSLAAYAIVRQYRPLAERTQLGLECALDHLERGEPKPTHALPSRTGGVMGAILDEVRRAIQQR